MKIESKIEHDIAIIHVKCNMTGTPETDELHDHVDKYLHQDIKRMIIDLKDVEWMGSVGLGALMRDLYTVCHAGGELLLANPSEKVLNLFKITKLAGVVKTFPSIKEALQGFKLH
jgi:anti-sigma B factor antagonist